MTELHRCKGHFANGHHIHVYTITEYETRHYPFGSTLHCGKWAAASEVGRVSKRKEVDHCGHARIGRRPLHGARATKMPLSLFTAVRYCACS